MPPEPSFSATPARTLRDLLRDEGRLPFDRAARILEQVGEALRRVHAGGLAYGMLEPARVHVDPGSGRVWLAETGTGDPQVKPAYLSPEQIDGRGPDMRSDIHALGLLGWELLTGREPWAGESLYSMVVKQREQDLPRLTTLRPGIPRPLLLAIEGALHKHPYDRWATVDELLAQLRSSRPVIPRPADPSPGATPVAGAAVVPPAPRPAPPIPPVAAAVPPRPLVAEPAPTPSGAPTARMAPPPSAVAPAAVARPGRRRWLATAALLLALLVAGGAALVAYQGRAESTQTAAWLDSLTTDAASGVVEIDSSADSLAAARRARAARLARDRARRDSVAAAQAAEPRPADSLSTAAPRADSAARPDTAARRDSVARRDSTPPDTTTRARPDSGGTGS